MNVKFAVLANPNATVPHLNLSCWKAELGGKLGFIEDCDGVREVCFCEAIDVGDITNTSQMPWAGLVGMSGNEARLIILQDMPSAIVEILPWGTLVFMEYRTDRVRIFIDEETGEVKETPRIG
jgi:Potato inhibitor I family